MSERWRQRVFSRTMYSPPFRVFMFKLWNLNPRNVRLLTLLAICVLILVPPCVTLQNQAECHCEYPTKPSQQSCSSTQFQNNVKNDRAAAILDLVSVLRWTSVTVFSERNTGVDDQSNSIMQELDSTGVSTMVFEMDARRWHNQIQNTTNLCDLAMKRPKHFLVFGSFSFVAQQFQQVAICAVRQQEMRALFDTEWITVVAQEELLPAVRSAVKPMENVAVVTEGQTGLSLWTVLHVRDDSQLSFVSSLPPPPSSPLIRHRILPNPFHGLGGRTLRVVVKGLSPYIITSTVEGSESYSGVLINLLQELALRLNFSYTFVPPSDDSWGQKLNNGQWDGPIGMLTRKEADIAVGYFTLTPERSSVADPTTPFKHDNAVIVFRKGTTPATTDHWGFFLQPFHTLVYVVVAGCLVMVLLLLLLLEKGHWSLAVGRRGVVPFGREEACLWVMWNLEVLVAGLVNRPSEHESASRAGRVLVVTWLLMSVVLASVYSSKLTSSLAVGQQAPPFTSLAQLVSQHSYTWGVQGGTSQEAMLKNSTIPDYQRFYQGIRQLSKSDPSVLSPDFDVHKSKVLQGKYAFYLATNEYFNVWSAETCLLTKLPEAYKSTSLGFYLQKGSPFTKMFSAKISLMVDSGLIDYWRRKWSPEKRQCEPDKGQNGRVIGLSDTQTAFYLAVLGLGLAGLVLGVERLVLRSMTDFGLKR